MEYQKALYSTIAAWNRAPIEDEWLFEKFRDQFVEPMSSSQAFDAIGETAVVLAQETDESTAIEILQTIISLAKKSETTEIPDALVELKKTLDEQFSSRGDYARRKMQELYSHYRI